VRRADFAQHAGHVRRERDGLAGPRVHVQQHLLGGGDQPAGRAQVHLVQDVQPLGVGAEHLDGEAQLLALAGLAQVAQVGLDRVERVSPVAVGVVDPEEAEEGVRAFPHDQQVRGFGEVMVVVGPLGADRHLRQPERGRDVHRALSGNVHDTNDLLLM
jgi:hypothetical protein